MIRRQSLQFGGRGWIFGYFGEAIK